jgi:hypothetical protein
MSILLPFNGQTYIIPTPGEQHWGSNLDAFFVAIAAGALQKSGGLFTLSAEADFGSPFGLKSQYFKSHSAYPASTGILRLANGDNISWRNNLNTLDLPLSVNASDQLTFNGVALQSNPSFTPYAVICAGTTPTGALQNVSGLGTSGQVLTSNGPATLPTWQAAGGGGSGTVNSGTQYELAYYATNGTAVSGNSNITTNASGQLLLSTGIPSIPSLAFSSDPGSGLFSASANELGFATNGSHWWSIQPGGSFYGKQAGSVIYNQDGTYQLPAYSFANSTAMGLYRWANNELGFSTDGTGASVARMGTYYGGWQFNVPDGSVTSPSYSFTGYTSAGMYTKSSVDFGSSSIAVLAADGGDGLWATKNYVRSIPNHYFADGTVALPGIRFWNLDAGIYKNGSNLAFASNGANILDASDTIGVQTKGTTLADDASAGYIGEYIESIVANQSVGTSGDYYDITSISLTPGDWDVSGLAKWIPNGASFATTSFELGISSTSGNSATGLVDGSNWLSNSDVVPISFSKFSMSIPVYRISIASTTTFYLKGVTASYSVATPQVSARLSARRVR